MRKKQIKYCPCGFPQSSPIPHAHSLPDSPSPARSEHQVTCNCKVNSNALELIKELTEALVFYHDNISSHVALEDGHVPCRTCDLLARAKQEPKR